MVFDFSFHIFSHRSLVSNSTRADLTANLSVCVGCCSLFFDDIWIVCCICRYEVGRFKEIERNREEIPVLELNAKDVLKLEERVYEARAIAKAVCYYFMCREVLPVVILCY